MGQQQSGNPVQPGVGDPESGGSGDPEVTWWCRLLIKVIAGVAGVIGIIMGIWTCVSIKALCIVAGIILIIVSLLVLMIELPFCCQFINFTKPLATFAERLSYMQKALIYGGLAIAPFAMCVGLSTLFGCGVIFATGVFYGLMALGRKADRSTMLARASSTNDQNILVTNEQLPS